VAGKVGLSWLPIGCGYLVKSFGAEDLLAYIYALFHSPSYRELYSDDLRRDFPRVIAPSSIRLFGRLSALGKELITFHLLRCKPSIVRDSSRASKLAPLSAAPSDQSVASFRAGGYVALRKWLQPKRRTTADPQYCRIVAAIARTVEIMAEIDGVVEQC